MSVNGRPLKLFSGTGQRNIHAGLCYLMLIPGITLAVASILLEKRRKTPMT